MHGVKWVKCGVRKAKRDRRVEKWCWRRRLKGHAWLSTKPDVGAGERGREGCTAPQGTSRTCHGPARTCGMTEEQTTSVSGPNAN